MAAEAWQVRAGRDDPDLVEARLQEALRLWRGPALAELADQPFARPIVARLDEAHLWAQQELVEIGLAGGRHAQLVTELEDLTARHPLCERLWAQRMLAYWSPSRQATPTPRRPTARRRSAWPAAPPTASWRTEPAASPGGCS